MAFFFSAIRFFVFPLLTCRPILCAMISSFFQSNLRWLASATATLVVALKRRASTWNCYMHTLFLTGLPQGKNLSIIDLLQRKHTDNHEVIFRQPTVQCIRWRIVGCRRHTYSFYNSPNCRDFFVFIGFKSFSPFLKHYFLILPN